MLGGRGDGGPSSCAGVGVTMLAVGGASPLGGIPAARRARSLAASISACFLLFLEAFAGREPLARRPPPAAPSAAAPISMLTSLWSQELSEPPVPTSCGAWLLRPKRRFGRPSGPPRPPRPPRALAGSARDPFRLPRFGSDGQTHAPPPLPKQHLRLMRQ